ncbi:phytoene desaturase family protein, partial [Streptomyces olivaceus]|uniref:phytoene desaturase family protein n=1 Tax=Streptomyces olivaceus TaxID=47716 RepID=UPI004056E525
MARIAVIGAGMGAMAAAARLAVAGHRVVVYERTGTYGGALGRFERDGFSFDTGPGLLPLPAVWRDLFVKTGKEPLESRVDLVQVDPSSRHVFADGTEVALPNASRAGVVAALDAALWAGGGARRGGLLVGGRETCLPTPPGGFDGPPGPGAGGGGPPARWGDFRGGARETWDRTRRPLLEEPLWPNWEVLAEREPYPSVPHRRLLRTRRAGTLAEVGALELRDPRLAALLDAHALAHGLDPRTAPANAAVLPYMEYAFGMWYVRGGGLRELARAVYERCLARRVEFRFGTEVTAVVEKDGRVRGVEPAEGVVEEAEFVVAGVPPDVLDRLRGGAGGTPVRPGGGVPPQRGGASRLTVLLALRGGRPEGTAHRTVVHARDREAELDGLFGAGPGMAAQPTVTVLRPDDPALVPDADHEAVTLSAPVPAPPAGTGRAAAGVSRS